jgi:hypothetical protein
MLLYIIPTVFCVIPNKTSHIILLMLAAILRGIFLARNFASRSNSQASKGIIYFIVAAIQALEYIIFSGAFFTAYAGMVTTTVVLVPNSTAAVAAAPATHPLLRTGTATTTGGTVVTPVP